MAGWLLQALLLLRQGGHSVLGLDCQPTAEVPRLLMQLAAGVISLAKHHQGPTDITAAGSKRAACCSVPAMCSS